MFKTWTWGSRAAGLFAVAGLVAFVVCLGFAFGDGQSTPTPSECIKGLFSEATDLPGTSPEDEGGDLRVLGVYPDEVEIGGTLCVVTAGVVTLKAQNAPQDDLERATKKLATLTANFNETTATPAQQQAVEQARAALTAAENKLKRPLPAVDLSVYLNDVLAPFVLKAQSIAAPQLLKLRLDAIDDAEQPGAKFWRDLLSGSAVVPGTHGKMEVELGLSRVEDKAAAPDAVAPETFTMRVFGDMPILWAVISLVLFLFSFACFAGSTTLLRDNTLTKGGLADRKKTLDDLVQNGTTQAEKDAAAAALPAIDAAILRYANYSANWPVGPFSLGRTQMAVWLFLVVAAFVFISMTIGQYLKLISPNVLVLLGISGATGLAAISITGTAADDRVTRGFVRDVLCDAQGPQLQRIQTVAWTLILGGIFVWVALRDFRLVAFDTNLLLLMGIASSLYLGFKAAQEK